MLISLRRIATNKAIKNRPQKARAGLANARLLLRRYVRNENSVTLQINFRIKYHETGTYNILR